MPVSPPEKTLEHWVSQYVTYRYRSHASLWWPVSGHDLAMNPIRNHGGSIGKTIQLELKTATHHPSSPEVHRVYVDVQQLFDYSRQPRGYWPFYVFPIPNWIGDIRDDYRAHLAHFPNPRAPRPADIAFGRSSEWWFVSRQVVLPLDVLARALDIDIGRTSARPSKQKVSLLTAAVTHRPGHHIHSRSVAVTWAWEGGKHTGLLRAAVPLQQFFTEINDCGRSTWPQLATVPSDILPGRSSYTYEDVRNILRELAFQGGQRRSSRTDERYDSNPVLLGPDDDGTFVVYEQTVDESDDEAVDPEMHLAQIAISPSGLF